MNTVPAVNAALAQRMPIPQLIDTLWQMYQHNIATGASNKIEMPVNLATVIGHQGIDTLVTRFRSLIGTPVSAYQNTANNTLQIMPARHLLGHDAIIPEVENSKVRTTKKAKIARPANAFILYRQHHHPLIKAKQPDIHNNAISVIVGLQWRSEDEATKAHFTALAKQAKAKHLLEHPGYQYQPRKPSEKKRRVSRRKETASANAVHSVSGSASKPATMATGVHSSEKEMAVPVPEVPKNSAGNAMLELGDEDLDDAAFAAMLEDYNGSMPTQNNILQVAMTQSLTTPVIYDEASEDAQDDGNFYLALQTPNPFTMTPNVMADHVEDMLQRVDYYEEVRGVMDPLAETMSVDEVSEAFFSAEVDRTSSW